jgi:hypothetical protein
MNEYTIYEDINDVNNNSDNKKYKIYVDLEEGTTLDQYYNYQHDKEYTDKIFSPEENHPTWEWTFCSASSLATCLSLYYHDLSIDQMDFYKSFSDGNGSLAQWGEDSANVLVNMNEGDGSKKYVVEKDEYGNNIYDYDGLKEYVKEIQEYLKCGVPVIVKVNRDGETYPPGGQHFITIVGIKESADINKEISWNDLVMIDSAPKPDSNYKISAVDDGYFRVETNRYVDYVPAHFRLFVPYFIDPETHTLINNTKTTDIEVYKQYLAENQPELLVNGTDLLPKLTDEEIAAEIRYLKALHNLIKQFPNEMLTVDSIRYSILMSNIQKCSEKIGKGNDEISKYYYYKFNGTENGSENAEFSLLSSKYNLNKKPVTTFKYGILTFDLTDKGPPMWQKVYALKEIMRLKPSIGFSLAIYSGGDLNKLYGNSLIEMLYSIKEGRFEEDFSILYDRNDKFNISNFSLMYDYYGNDKAGVGEGLEEDNSILPENGSDKTITIGDEVYLVDRLKEILKIIQGIATGGLENNDTAGVGEGIEEDNETLPESEAEKTSSTTKVMLEEKIPQILAQAEIELAHAQTTVSPLVLDTDGNGFETNAKADGVYFDLDNNGFAEKTAWTSGDAFLTYDLNGNGKIDNGGELFGNHTLVGESKAADGFAALAQYDENADGVINENDDIYHLMRLWNDNGDGVSEDGEFKTLEEMGVSSIDLNQTAPENATYTDATVSGVSNAEMSDGTSRTVADFWFNVSTADTMQIYDGEFDADILALPDVRSFGKMPSLRVAMQLDESGVLKELVADFIASRDVDERDLLLKQIFYKMTGADSISPTSRGSYIDARDLHVLETIDLSTYLDGIEHVTVSGESGREARICDFEWVTAIRDECEKRVQLFGSKVQARGSEKMVSFKQ